MAATPTFSCAPDQLAAVADLLGGQATTASTVCSSFNVSAVGADGAVLRYLAKQASSGLTADEAVYGLNVTFVLFSGYLVFMMQGGFAMVRYLFCFVLFCRVCCVFVERGRHIAPPAARRRRHPPETELHPQTTTTTTPTTTTTTKNQKQKNSCAPATSARRTT